MRLDRGFFGGSLGRISGALSGAVAFITLIGAGVHPAGAQYIGSQSAQYPDSPPAPGIGAPPAQDLGVRSSSLPPASPAIEILATPYLWLPWTSVGVRPADTRLSSASTTIGPGDLITHLTWVPFMGEAEFRSGPFGLLTDYIHAPLKAGVSTKNVLLGAPTRARQSIPGPRCFYIARLRSPSSILTSAWVFGLGASPATLR
jgi:hypothetical protein